jgi:hypothetical protein
VNELEAAKLVALGCAIRNLHDFVIAARADGRAHERHADGWSYFGHKDAREFTHGLHELVNEARACSVDGVPDSLQPLYRQVNRFLQAHLHDGPTNRVDLESLEGLVRLVASGAPDAPKDSSSEDKATGFISANDAVTAWPKVFPQRNRAAQFKALRKFVEKHRIPTRSPRSNRLYVDATKLAKAVAQIRREEEDRHAGLCTDSEATRGQ